MGSTKRCVISTFRGHFEDSKSTPLEETTAALAAAHKKPPRWAILHRFRHTKGRML